MNESGKIKSGSFVLLYRLIDDDAAEICGYEEGGSSLYIPGQVCDQDGRELLVRSIAAKAFFANTIIRQITIPGSVKAVGDWAFAKCINMRDVFVSSENIEEQGGLPSIGRGIFDGCQRVENINLFNDEKNHLSALVAATVSRMPAEYLLKDGELGSPAWYGKWDQCLSTFLNEPDIDGYTDLVLCGEEDIFYNEPDFAENKRRKKASLCFLRLMNDTLLPDGLRKKYTDYLLGHNKHSATEEAWQVLMHDVDDDVAYYRLFAQIGGISEDNIDDMINDLGEGHPEPKAYLIGYNHDHFQTAGNVFDQFEL